MLAYIFRCIFFKNHRNLNSDLYPRKSLGPENFQGVPKTIFPILFISVVNFLGLSFPLAYKFTAIRKTDRQKVCSEKDRQRQPRTRWATGQYEMVSLSDLGQRQT